MGRRTEIARAQHEVLAWYRREKRSFSWRAMRDPYRILVSEVMLQQTQTSRVVPAYRAFLRRFPTLRRLALAPAGDVLKAWGSLGYNRRALGLHRAAQAIVDQHGGRVPDDPAVLRSLPGIGPYTASAVACFAYDSQVPVVDTNVRRVVSRASLGVDAPRADARDVEAAAAAWLPDGRAYEWNQALMDIGATLCRGAEPRCSACPLRTVCVYRRRPPTTQARRATREPRFEGSRRQRRGAVVRVLREANGPVTLAALSRMVPDVDEVLDALASDGLIVLSNAARSGSPRGRVRLP